MDYALRKTSPTYSVVVLVPMKVHNIGIQTALPYSNFMMDAATQAGPRVRDTAIQTTTQVGHSLFSLRTTMTVVLWFVVNGENSL